jgi:nifR3 family TIM-barrel protein
MLKIGNVTISEPIAAAPLAGITNPVYREMCRRFGAGLVVSEMISDKALHYKSRKTQEMCRTLPDEHPVALQLFGSDPVTMAEASEYLTKNTDCDIIDINMGCPVNKVIKAHAGSWLMRDEELAADIVKAVKDHTDRPVTVKIRAGWDKEHITCVQIARLAEKAGASAVTVHGRTRGQLYAGKSDNRYIRMVKEAVSVPVIGNGDIRTVQDAQRMFEETGCDAIMIGRGLLGRPYFLQELNAAFEGGSYREPDYNERLDLTYEYAVKLCEYESEYTGMCMMRSMAAWYISGLPYAAGYKNRLCQVNTLREMKDILEEFRMKLKAEYSVSED